jgi:autotransporter-associated beta strand protein
MKKIVNAISMFSIAYSLSALAASTWTGATNGNWATVGNWSGGVPGTAQSSFGNYDTAIFSGTNNTAVTVGVDRNLGWIQLNAGGPFTIGSGTLYLRGNDGFGSIYQSGMDHTTTFNSNIVLTSAYVFQNSVSNAANLLNFTGGVTANNAEGNSTTLWLDGINTGSNTISGVISDGTGATMALEKIGTGTWVLSGANTYTGTTTLTAGTVNLGAAENAGTSGPLGNSSASNPGSIVLNGGYLQYSTANQNDYSGRFSTAATQKYNVDTNGQNVTWATALTSSGGTLTKTGAGTLTLNNKNTYTGGTTVNGGTLSIINPSNNGVSAIGTGTLTINSGATVATTGSADNNHNPFGFSAGTLHNIVINGGTLSAGTPYSWVDNITLTGGTVTGTGRLDMAQVSGQGFTNMITANAGVTANIINVSQLDLNTMTTFNTVNTASLSVSTAMSGQDGLTKTGTGTLTLSGTTANSYTGLTTVSAGELDLNKTDGINAIAGNLTISGGTAKLLTNNQIANTSTITMTSGALSLNGQTDTVTGFSNSGGIFTTGAGHLIGTGNTVTWSGGTNTVNNGGIVEDPHIVITGGTNTVEGGATGGVLQLNSGGSGLVMSNGSTLTLNSDNAVAGKLLLNGDVSASGDSTVTIASSLALSNKGKIDLNAGTRTFTVADGSAANDMAVSAVITNGSLTKAGAGLLLLSGANTYTGTTSVNGGTLLLDFSAAGAPTSNIIAAASALTLNGGILGVKGTAGQNGIIQSFNGTTTPGTSGVLNGTLQLTQNGATEADVSLGALALTGATDFRGATGIGAGARYITTTSAGSDDAHTQLGGGALWNGSGFASVQAVGGTKYVVQFIDQNQIIYTGTAGGKTVVIPNVAAKDALVDIQENGSVGAPNYLAAATTTIQSLIMNADTTASVVKMNQNSANDTLVVGSNVAGSTNGAIAVGTGGKALTIGQTANQGFVTAGTSGASTVNLTNASATSLLTLNSKIVDNAEAGVVSAKVSNTANGTSVFGGDNTYTGTTTISSGTLQVGAGGTTGSLGGGSVIDNATLAFNRSDALTVANAISGTGMLNQMGTGITTLSGINIYSGGTLINAGAVQVSNSSALGTGAVTSNATLDIGATTLNIGNGNYTQNAGSTLMVAVNGATSGSVTTTGIATVNAASGLVLNVSNYYIANNATYKIIQGGAGGAIAAPILTVLGNNQAGFTATTIGDNLILTASRAANGFASDANPGDANARAVGTVLDNITNPSADMTNVLNTMTGLSKSQVAAALDTMVPQVDAGVINTDRASLNNFTGISIDRVEKAHTEGQSKRSARSGVSSGEEDKLDGLWAKGYGSYLNQGTRGGIAGYSAWNAGTALGIDRRFTDAVTLGISGGYAYGNVNSDANSANTTINSAQTTLYGGYQDQKRPFFIDTAVTFAYNWYAGRRNINVGNVILRTANGSYDGQQYGAYLGGGYKFKFADAIEVTPLVSLQYNNLHINSYNETGAGALNLNAGTQNYNQLQSGLGARIATTLNSQWGKVTPELHSKWLYDFFGDPFAVTSTFNGGGAAFGANGAKPAVNSFNVGGELKLDLKDEIAITGKIDTQLRQGFSGVFGSFTVRF